MENEMTQLEINYKASGHEYSALKDEEAKLIKAAKQKANQRIHELNHQFDEEEIMLHEQMIREIEEYRVTMVNHVEKEMAFYQKEYDEKKEEAREKLIKEIFAYGNRKNE